MNNAPQNINLLQPTKFVLTFSDVPDTVYFCQKVKIPGLSIGFATQTTPNLDFFLPGTKLTFNEFEIDFLVNEDLSSWSSIYYWMKNLTTDDVKTRRRQGDATLTILSNLNNPKLRVKFFGIFPLNLGDIEMDTTLSAEEHMVATSTFKYDYFLLEKI
jgi:hypothetical protein